MAARNRPAAGDRPGMKLRIAARQIDASARPSGASSASGEKRHSSAPARRQPSADADRRRRRPRRGRSRCGGRAARAVAPAVWPRSGSSPPARAARRRHVAAGFDPVGSPVEEGRRDRRARLPAPAPDGARAAPDRACCGSTPRTGMPSGASASGSSAACRGEPTRLRIRPASRDIARDGWRSPAPARPPNGDWRAQSTTSTILRPSAAARSAAEPLPSAAPSNRPIIASTTRPPVARASAASPSSSAGRIAQGSRLTQGAPLAAAWKAGSI